MVDIEHPEPMVRSRLLQHSVPGVCPRDSGGNVASTITPEYLSQRHFGCEARWMMKMHRTKVSGGNDNRDNPLVWNG